MKINEIAIGPSRDENLDGTFSRHFFNVPITKVINHQENISLKHSNNYEVDRYGIFKDTHLIAYMSVITNELNLPSIGQTATDVKFRRQGWIRYLIDYFLDTHQCLCTDETHSNEAKEMWKALIQTPYTLKFYLIDKITGEKIQIGTNQHSTLDPDPWTKEYEHWLIVATKRPLTEGSKKRIIERAIEGWYPYGKEYENSSVWNP